MYNMRLFLNVLIFLRGNWLMGLLVLLKPLFIFVDTAYISWLFD